MSENKKPRILILCRSTEFDLGASYFRAFNRLGLPVQLINPVEELEKLRVWRNRVLRRVFERQLVGYFNRHWFPSVRDNEADVVFAIKGNWALPTFWRRLKNDSPSKTLVCFNPDNPIRTFSRGANRPWVTESIGEFDLYCTYNRKILGDLSDFGAKESFWLPFGWDDGIHPVSDANSEEVDLLFIGNGDAHREEWLSKVLSSQAAESWRVEVIGKWRKVSCSKLSQAIVRSEIQGAQMAARIANSKVSLNILRLQNDGSHNMRTFEVPGSGGVMASQFSEEQDYFFPNGRAAVYFRDAGEAVEQISGLIQDERLRTSIRKRARNLVQNHTYLQRAQDLLARIESTCCDSAGARGR